MADLSATGASASAASPEALASSSEAQPQAKKPEAETAPDFRKFKHKLKVNEKEEDLDYDTVIKLAQKGKAADEVFRKASAKEKQMAALFERAKAGDLDWIEEIAGEKAREWAEKRLMKHIELMEMSPEKRELLEEKRRRESLEKELSTREEREKSAAAAQVRDQAAQEIDTKIDEAFKTSGLPMTPGRLERVAQIMDASLSQTGTLLDPTKALSIVQKQMRADAREILESLKPEELSEFLPKKILDAIRRKDVADVRAQDPMRRSTQDATPVRRLSDAKVKRMSTDDFFNKLEKKLGG